MLARADPPHYGVFLSHWGKHRHGSRAERAWALLASCVVETVVVGGISRGPAVGSCRQAMERWIWLAIDGRRLTSLDEPEKTETICALRFFHLAVWWLNSRSSPLNEDLAAIAQLGAWVRGSGCFLCGHSLRGWAPMPASSSSGRRVLAPRRICGVHGGGRGQQNRTNIRHVVGGFA